MPLNTAKFNRTGYTACQSTAAQSRNTYMASIGARLDQFIISLAKKDYISACKLGHIQTWCGSNLKNSKLARGLSLLSFL